VTLQPWVPENWDLGLIKNVKFNERFAFQLRAEFFNAFNHTNFGSVETGTQRSELRAGHGNASSAQRSTGRKDHFLIGEWFAMRYQAAAEFR
jgi:hypothetical protein